MALINTLRMKRPLRAHPGVAWQAAYPEIEMGTPNGNPTLYLGEHQDALTLVAFNWRWSLVEDISSVWLAGDPERGGVVAPPGVSISSGVDAPGHVVGGARSSGPPARASCRTARNESRPSSRSGADALHEPKALILRPMSMRSGIVLITMTFVVTSACTGTERVARHKPSPSGQGTPPVSAKSVVVLHSGTGTLGQSPARPDQVVQALGIAPSDCRAWSVVASRGGGIFQMNLKIASDKAQGLRARALMIRGVSSARIDGSTSFTRFDGSLHGVAPTPC
jgi:hypothetical protein